MEERGAAAHGENKEVLSKFRVVGGAVEEEQGNKVARYMVDEVEAERTTI